MPQDFARYLAAKRSVESRALNAHVWQTLLRSLAAARSGEALRLLEIGGGSGSMFRRLVESGWLPPAEYTIVEREAAQLQAARQELPGWAAGVGLDVQPHASGLNFSRAGGEINLQLVEADFFPFAARSRKRWDLLIAHAFLDLVDVPRALEAAFPLLRPGGLFYFPINYDGLTIFEPPIDPQLEEQIFTLYHRSMDRRQTGGMPSGDSQTGRRLFRHLRHAGAELLAAGASDWVVFPRAGAYPDDEAYFLEQLLSFIEGELDGHPELDAGHFAGWIAARRAQVTAGELVLIAHQLDFFGNI